MSPIAIGLIVFVCVFGGALLGMFLRTVLPAHHLSDESRDVVKLVTGLIATLAALVLGFLVATAKDAFDMVNEGSGSPPPRSSCSIVRWRNTDPETKDLREFLGRGYAARLDQLFPQDRSLRRRWTPSLG